MYSNIRTSDGLRNLQNTSKYADLGGKEVVTYSPPSDIMWMDAFLIRDPNKDGNCGMNGTLSTDMIV